MYTRTQLTGLHGTYTGVQSKSKKQSRTRRKRRKEGEIRRYLKRSGRVEIKKGMEMKERKEREKKEAKVEVEK